MSEKIQLHNSVESQDHKSEAKAEKPVHSHEKTTEHHHVRHEHKDKIDEILSKIEKSAKSAEDLPRNHNQEKEDDSYKGAGIGSQLRSQGLKQSLNKIQKELPSYQRGFSKFIHNSKVDKISEATGATIARPSGLLTAGIFSFIASLGVLTVCRYFGYEYNFLIGLVSLGAGFFVGLFFEGIIKVFKKA